MTFKERYLAGEIAFEEIDAYVEEWNKGDDARTLACFLGLDAEEEDVWIEEGDEALKEALGTPKEMPLGTPKEMPLGTPKEIHLGTPKKMPLGRQI